MARNMPQQEIQDTEGWTLVDCNMDNPGTVARRGPLTATGATSAGKANRFPLGIARVQDPAGTEQTVIYCRTTAPAGEVYGFGNTSAMTSFAWPYTPTASSPADLFQANDVLLGGTYLGSANKYDKPTNQTLQLWRGASLPNWTTMNCTGFTTGATTITVTTDIAHCSPGHHVFDTGTGNLVGVIKTIASNVITLEHPALYTGSTVTQIDVKVMRGTAVRVATGRITCSAADTTFAVNGGSTKFKAQGVTSSYDLYTPDYTFVGSVASVTSDAYLQLVAAPLVSLVNSPYILIKRNAVYTGTPLGWLTATFAGHQFYADGNNLRFSSSFDPEAVDITADGDFLTFSADPIRAIVPTTSALVVITETEVFALVGAVGTTPDRWRGTRIHDDGTVCGMTCVQYKGGALWAGKRGIWFYDGASPINVAGKLDADYRLALSTFTSSTTRAYSAIVKDHLLVWFEAVKSGVFDINKNGTVTHVTRPTIAINLSDGTLCLWQNVEIRGGIQPADVSNLGTALLPIQTLESAVNTSRVVVGETLFTDTGQDAWTCNGAAAAGPDLFVETKKYSMGDMQRLKLHRMLLLEYITTGGNIRFDYVPGLNQTGTLAGTEFLDSSTVWIDKRIKFNSRSQYLSLRFYQSPYQGNPANLTPANTTRIGLGAWALGFKWKRPGRV
jgi:hypothetical protein